MDNNTKVWIKQVSYHVPENIISNKDIIDLNQLKIKDEWIKNRIGIENRRWVDKQTAASDLAVEAILKMNLQDFDGPIFVSTISPDYPTPSTASIIKKKLQLENDSPAIDISAACAGHLFALDLAKSKLLTSHYKQALVVATETRSKFLNKADRRTVFLFSDAAVVFLIEKSDNPTGDIEWIETKTIASKEFEILVPSGGSVAPYENTEEAKSTFYPFIKMNDGEKIVEATTVSLITIVTESLTKHNQKVSDFDFFVFHQGNGDIIKNICINLNIPLNKTEIIFNQFGNSSSSSMGLAFAMALENGNIKNGDRVLLISMGAGYHVGLSSILWNQR